VPENNLQVDPKNRIGTGPLFLQVKLRFKRVFLEKKPLNKEFFPALTKETLLRSDPRNFWQTELASGLF
jgi:hypothetical protein